MMIVRGNLSACREQFLHICRPLFLLTGSYYYLDLEEDADGVFLCETRGEQAHHCHQFKEACDCGVA